MSNTPQSTPTNAAAFALADQIARAFTGPMWHGPAIRDALDGLTARDAHVRPIARAHSAWEMTLHLTTWCDVARARLSGAVFDSLPDDVDWPPSPPSSPPPSDEIWRAAVDACAAAHEALAAAVRALSDDALRREVVSPASRCTIDVMLRGVAEHGAYHAGQIVLLRRAAATRDK